VTPGRKELVTVKVSETKTHEQKRLVPSISRN
jgi:hypothetical protein